MAKTAAFGYKELKKEIDSGQLGRLYCLYGEESYLREFSMKSLRESLIAPGTEEWNLHELSAPIDLRELSQAVDALPMMGEHSLVVVSDYDFWKAGEEAREQLCEIFSDLPDYCCLVFYFDTVEYKRDGRLKKLAAAFDACGREVEFARQGQRELTTWIRRRFKALGKDVSDSDAEYLTFLCGSIMTGLVPEIEKIAACATGSEVTKADIDMVATPTLSAVAFDMTNAIADGHFERAVTKLSELYALREEPIKILGALGYQLRRLHSARVAIDCGKGEAYITKVWGGSSDYAARLLMRSARQFTTAWCARACVLCAETDMRLKSEGGDKEKILEMLLLRLAQS